nr:immunoglobulin heavy chain junction region [Macaca mulatta]MOV56506.1 immunoglobulin heavy chain junction region [Macaca mulatta]MOV56900.1 immunoglobulin heavy chain junction region [Macaca mulatta]MOV59292.1 immunoglobulin heavy chain junction region [Macaca mulatta]MOV59813.1 immunoglobulin heavy chain junction region [Macaca mulatta]
CARASYCSGIFCHLHDGLDSW